VQGYHLDMPRGEDPSLRLLPQPVAPE